MFCLDFQRLRAQHIIPCTVSQIKSAIQSEDVFKVGEVEIAQVGEAFVRP